MGLHRREDGVYSVRERDHGQFAHSDPDDPNSGPPAAFTIGVMPNGMQNEAAWEAQQRKNEAERDETDEANRIKAMRWERKREERRLQKLQERTSEMREEAETWQRATADMSGASEELKRREQAARDAEARANEAVRRAEEAASTKGGGDDSKILAEAAADIKKHVEEAYQLPAAERKKKVRDLRMRWHPDKNPMLRSLADEISKIINLEIERCKEQFGD